MLTPAIDVWGLFSTPVFFIALSLCLLFFSATYTQFVGNLRTGITDFFAPVFSAVNMPIQASVSFVQNVGDLAQIQSQNEILTKENEKLRHWYHKAVALEQENKDLRTLLNIPLEVEQTYITGRIVIDSNNPYVKTLLVSRGLKDGVKSGQAVLSGHGLVGRIIEAGEHTSRVLLVNDINSRIPIVVEGTGENAIMSGRNTNMPILEHVPPKSKIEQGVHIMTSGTGGVFPAGLPIGRLRYNQNGDHQVELYADFERLMFVRIVNAGKEQYFIQTE